MNARHAVLPAIREEPCDSGLMKFEFEPDGGKIAGSVNELEDMSTNLIMKKLESCSTQNSDGNEGQNRGEVIDFGNC